MEPRTGRSWPSDRSASKEFPTLINGVRYRCLGRDRPGAYRMRGKKPFAGYIYGWSNYDSYCDPLSVALGDLSKDDPDAPEIRSTQDCAGNVLVKTNDMPEDPDRRTNLSTIELDPASYNFIFDPRPVFDPGETIATDFKLRVKDLTADAMAILVISDGRGNTSRDTFYYTAFNMTMTENPTDFGSMNAGAEPATQNVRLRNLASRPVLIKSVILKFGNRGFRVVEPVGEFTIGAAGTPTASRMSRSSSPRPSRATSRIRSACVTSADRT